MNSEYQTPHPDPHIENLRFTSITATAVRYWEPTIYKYNCNSSKIVRTYDLQV